MPVSREEVICCYRYILGREPESEEAIQSHLPAVDAKTLRERFVLSPEFSQRYRKLRGEEPHGSKALDRKVLAHLSKQVQLSERWAAVPQGKLCLARAIEAFDDGFWTLSVTDEAGNWMGVLDFAQVKELLQKYPPKKILSPLEYSLRQDGFALYADDEKELRRRIVCSMQRGVDEVPVLQDGKIKSLGRFAVYAANGEGNHYTGKGRIRDILQPRWELISDEVAREYFAGKPRVIISSDAGGLKGFYNRFQNMLRITLTKDAAELEKWNEQYDVLLFDAKLWDDASLQKEFILNVYAVLLQETIFRYLELHGVRYKYIDVDTGYNDIPENRVSGYLDGICDPLLMERDSVCNYFVSYKNSMQDLVDGKPVPNIYFGRRVTLPPKKHGTKHIFLFGGCIVTGSGVIDPDQTIASSLQEILNKSEDGGCYGTVNCGIRGFDLMRAVHVISDLHHIADTSFQAGDFVIHFGRTPKMQRSKILSMRYIALWDLFSSPPYHNGKFFCDNRLVHPNKAGIAVIAQSLYRMIKSELSPTRENRRVSPLSCMCTSHIRSALLGYLSSLPQQSDRDTISACGAIFCSMPLHKGILHAMIHALQHVDRLYVFIHSRNDTMFSKEQCYAMANSNAFLHEKQVHGHLQLVSKGYLVKSSYIGLDFRSPYLAKVGTSHIITNQVDYEPADDPYVFARYIAPRLGISTFFSGEDSGDLFADRYRLLRREFLESEGIRWVSIPRLRLPDGRKIATKEIRSILAEQGLEAAKDYLTEETYQYLATQTVDGFLKRKEGKA